jgi:cytochrome c biogenesis protein CcdA/thiol-disulfide isomerase/thioredoxin
MLVLIAIGLLAGVVTAISPCVLPVLPVLLAGGAAGRKPLRIIAGLIASFSFFTLFATWVLGKLGLPEDLLRNLAIAFLVAMAIVLLLPQAGLLLERGLAPFSRLRSANAGGGYLLGVSLGLVFVPCAGPFLGAITAAAANENFGVRTIAATLAYAVGAGLPMLAIAFGGREAALRIRQHAEQVRRVSGALIAAVAVALVFHLDDHLTQLHVPGLTGLENSAAGSSAGKKALARVRGERAQLTAVKKDTGDGLPDYGAAPPLRADGAWINSPPRTIEQLRGKVVLVDFWTYSCINCLRTLPHIEAWDAAYRSKGLVIVGVHTPEFAFEHVTSNVRAAVRRLGIHYAVVQDNRYRTWDAYANEYWPAEYLIDRQGRIRYTDVGEGHYDKTEAAIRQLLGGGGAHARRVADMTPTGLLTPESYLGYARLENYVGRNPVPDRFAQYTFPPTIPQSTLAYDGQWRVGSQAITAGPGARLRLRFQASNVYIVMGGRGTVQAFIDGKPTGTLHVDAQRLYTVRASTHPLMGLLELRFSPGVQAYSFTFG